MFVRRSKYIQSTYLDVGFQNILELIEAMVQFIVDQNDIKKSVLRNTKQNRMCARFLFPTMPKHPNHSSNALLNRTLRSPRRRSSVAFSATPASSINPLSIATILNQPTARTTQHSLTNPCISDSALPLSPCCDHADALRGFQSMEAE